MFLLIYFPYFCSQKGQTPLHYAAQNDHSQVVTLFLNHKPGVMMQQNAVGNSYMCHRPPSKRQAVGVTSLEVARSASRLQNSRSFSQNQ